MTEYDYSPEAIEHHHARQSHVANWVDRTHQHAPVFANPFIPTSRSPSEAHHHHSSSTPQSISYSPSYYTNNPYGVGVIPTQQYLGSSSSYGGHKHRHRRNSWSNGMYANPYYGITPGAPPYFSPTNPGMGYGYGTYAPMVGMQRPLVQAPYYGGGYYPYPGLPPFIYPSPTPASTYYTPAYGGYPGYGVGSFGYPPAYYPQTYPYLPMTTPSSHSHHHRSLRRRHSDPELYAMSSGYPYASMPAAGAQVVQSPSNHSAYVPLRGGGYAIIPPGQTAVVSPTGNYPYAGTNPYYYPAGGGGYDSDDSD